jgi:hypothetical protein
VQSPRNLDAAAVLQLRDPFLIAAQSLRDRFVAALMLRNRYEIAAHSLR